MIWKYKPWWCQPWSIILTGLTIIFGSWLGIHSLILTITVSLLIIIWWGYFLIIYPQLISKLMDDQRIEKD